ncbi:MAG TPA: hypothetical protein PLB73_12245, partial [Leptospiraceae bacterium]|nr:hypothetical protein [Leptospiraceae bacterium]
SAPRPKRISPSLPGTVSTAPASAICAEAFLKYQIAFEHPADYRKTAPFAGRSGECLETG